MTVSWAGFPLDRVVGPRFSNARVLEDVDAVLDQIEGSLDVRRRTIRKGRATCPATD